MACSSRIGPLTLQQMGIFPLCMNAKTAMEKKNNANPLYRKKSWQLISMKYTVSVSNLPSHFPKFIINIRCNIMMLSSLNLPNGQTCHFPLKSMHLHKMTKSLHCLSGTPGHSHIRTFRSAF